ncbi:MAG: VOC family protein [Solirubrobacteraceae bacterium MAG38_C4-C5]|nr:VOC family protein [Candidatus Siliceabacter maunaloa]
MSLASAQVRATIAVSDMTNAVNFYEGTLGLPPRGDEIMDHVRIYSCAGGSLLQVYASEHAGTATATVASWSADDFESVVDDLRAKGVTFETQGGPETDERGVHTFGGHKVVWFKDPDGNTIAVDNGGAPS